MSWKLLKEVREARLAGLYADIEPTEFSILGWMAENCRGESRVASISMNELVALTGRYRSTVSGAVGGLLDKKCVTRTFYGSPGQASKYEIQPPATRTDNATCSRTDNATCDDNQHVALSTEHVALSTEHVASRNTTRCVTRHIPSPSTPVNKTVKSVARARKAHTPITEDWLPPRDVQKQLILKYPRLDLKAELEAFISYHLARGNERADWTHAFRNWLGKTNAYGAATNGHAISPVDQKAADWQALKQDDDVEPLKELE